MRFSPSSNSQQQQHRVCCISIHTPSRCVGPTPHNTTHCAVAHAAPRNNVAATTHPTQNPTWGRAAWGRAAWGRAAPARKTTSASAGVSNITNAEQGHDITNTEQGHDNVVLVLPGYLRDASDYVDLVNGLRSRGFDAWVAPIRWYHWLPTVGGRSMRPILDRIHYAVNHLVNARENNATQHNTGVDDKNSSITPNSTQPISMMTHVHITPEPAYGLVEFIQEMRDASQGSAVPVLQHLSLQDAMPGEDKGNTQGEKGRKEKGKEEKRKEEQQQQRDMRRIALVGHSASGWVGRLYLGSNKPYAGRIYPGASRVHTLCMLGAPQYTSDGITSRNLDFVNTHVPMHADVRYIQVASKTVQGKSYGIVQDFAYQSYSLCCGKGQGELEGDGVIPVVCATALEGADTLVLEGVWHDPTDAAKGRLWYGSPSVVDQWVSMLRCGVASRPAAHYKASSTGL